MPKLKCGDMAPNFAALTFDGRRIDLTALRGKKVWLSFQRYANCPLCVDKIREIGMYFDELKNGGVEVLAIFQTRPSQVTKNPYSGVPFPLLVDPHKEAFDLYGTESNLAGVFRPSVGVAWLKAKLNGAPRGPRDGDLGQLPAHFLIDETGRIHTAFYGKTIADHVPWWQVRRFLAVGRAEKQVEAERSRIWEKFYSD